MSGAIDPSVFARLFRSTTEPVLLVDDEGRVQGCNSAACAYFALDPAEPAGTTIFERIAESPAELAPALRRWAQSSEFLPGVLTRRVPGARPERVRCDGALLEPRRGDRPALLLLRCNPDLAVSRRFLLLNEKIDQLSREISDRKRAEAELWTQRETYRVTLASVGDAVITTDTALRVTFMNAVAERETGWRVADAVGHPLEEVFDVVDEDSRQRVSSPVAEAIRRGTPVGLLNHTVLLRRDGTEVPIEDSAAPIRDEAGHVLGVILVFHGIAERRRAEREVAAALASEQRSRRDAETANRTKDEFLATLSHELRTPLNAILGWSQLLQDDAFPVADRAEGLATIERNARMQVQLIDDLLDMSRIMSGKLRLEVELVDAGVVLDAALDSVRPTALAKGITLAREVEGEPLRVLADANRLQQVFRNLLSNAIKFTPRQGSIVVRAGRQGTQVEFSVTDTGIGIAPEFQPHVFERFRQADSSTTRGHGGLGLGLSIARHLVELHGGTVGVASEGPGRGSTFAVTLPLPAVLVPPERPPEARGAAPREREREEDVRLDGLRVLVVDDEADARDLVRRLLVLRGAEVKAASHVEEALRLLDAYRPDVVISDIGMPGHDGYELMRRIRALPPGRGGRVPAVALTAFVRSEDRTKILGSGYQAHVPKPVESDELATVVARVVR